MLGHLVDHFAFYHFTFARVMVREHLRRLLGECFATDSQTLCLLKNIGALLRLCNCIVVVEGVGELNELLVPARQLLVGRRLASVVLGLRHALLNYDFFNLVRIKF